MARVGQPLRADWQNGERPGVREWYTQFGRRAAESITALLPADFTFEGKRLLDFGCGSGRVLRHFLDRAGECELWGCDPDEPSIEWLRESLSPPLHVFRNDPEPPLDLPDAHFDLIWSVSVFTHLTDNWSTWLLELHRILKPGGLLLATFIGPQMASEMTGEQVGEDELGMNAIALGRNFANDSGPIVFHSHWWIRAHWGRAFEILELQPDRFAREHETSQGAVLMRRRDVELSRDDLEWHEPGERRELAAWRTNIRQLRAEHERQLRRQRNAMRRLRRELGAAPPGPGESARPRV